MFCTKCGAQLKETQKFCVNCGAKAPERPASPGEEAQPAAPTIQPAKPTVADTRVEAPQQQIQPVPPAPAPPITRPADSKPPIESPASPRPPAEPPTLPRTDASSPRPSYEPPRSSDPSREEGLQTTKKIVSRVPLSNKPSTPKRNPLWLWIGAAVMVFAAGGYLGYRHWHPSHVPKQAMVPTRPANSASKPAPAITPENGAAASSNAVVKPSGPATSALPPSSQVAPNIRSVDFKNFSYPSDCWRSWSALPMVVRVSQGQWSKPVSGLPTFRYFFSVDKVEYGDIGPGGQEAAVVHTACGGPANFQYNEVFVFGATPSGPKLLAHLIPGSWGAGQEDNDSLFQVTKVQTIQKQLAISFYAGDSHAAPKWIDTATFTWQGNGLVRTGLTRRPFTPIQASGNPNPPNSSQVNQVRGQQETGGTSTHQVISKTTPVNSSPNVEPTSVNPQQIVQPTNPGQQTRTAVSPPPPPPTPIATSGTVVWSGHLDKNATITIQGSSASSGSLQGQLPGVPVMILVSPSNIAVAEFPGPQNGWKEVVLRGNKNQNVVVRIQWKRLQ